MGRIKMFYGLGVAILPDVGAGILVAHVACKIFGEAWWAYILGPVFALIPDFDAALQPLLKKKLDTRHRDMMHKPLVLLGAALGVTAVFPFIGSIIFVSLLMHFLHDSIGNEKEVGWGLRWLWPLSNNQYAFFRVKDERWRFIAVWTPSEIAQISPIGLKEWLETNYIHLCPSSIRAWASFVAVCIVVVLW